jgi:hypothetical protein
VLAQKDRRVGKVKLLEGVLGMMETTVGWGGEENVLREPGFLMNEWTGFNEKEVVIEGMGDLKGVSLLRWDMDGFKVT